MSRQRRGTRAAHAALRARNALSPPEGDATPYSFVTVARLFAWVVFMICWGLICFATDLFHYNCEFCPPGAACAPARVFTKDNRTREATATKPKVPKPQPRNPKCPKCESRSWR